MAFLMNSKIRVRERTEAYSMHGSIPKLLHRQLNSREINQAILGHIGNVFLAIFKT